MIGGTINDNSFDEKKKQFLTDEALYRDAGTYLGIKLSYLKFRENGDKCCFRPVIDGVIQHLDGFRGFKWDINYKMYCISKPTTYTDPVIAERATNFFNKLKFIF